MMRARLLSSAALVVCFAVAAAACGNQSPPPVPGTFDRPGRVAFVCFQTTGRESPRPVPFRLCKDAEDQPVTVANTAMHALITQTSRGEVAAVDLKKRSVLDSRQDKPGYTFLPVGELPSAIAVAREHPNVTYVANFGSRTISVLRTGAFRDLSVGENATLQTVRVRLPSGGETVAPFDMVLSPDEDALFVAIPDASAVLRMPIIRCASGAAAAADGGMGDGGGADCLDGSLDESGITQVSLEASLGLALSSMPGAAAEEPYALACDPSGLLPARASTGAAIDDDAANRMPEPVSLTVDAFCEQGTPCTRRLLVADRSLPIVHVLDLDALTTGADAVLAPIVTGAPTLAVAVTPRVPRTLDDDASETQYVYAIDARDGSVLVTQDGKLLSVSTDPATRPDRIALGAVLTIGNPVAASLAVLTPGFDVSARAAQYVKKSACTDDNHPEPLTPSRLRGVFLAVGVNDGTVRIVDVHDMELKACRSCAQPKPHPYPVVRHQARIAAVFDPTEALPRMVPSTSPTFIVDSTVVPVNADGTTRDPRIEGLSCLDCAAPLLDAFPNPADLVDIPDAGPSDAGVDAGDPAAVGGDAGMDAAIDSGAPDTSDAAVDAGSVVDSDPARPGVGRRCAEGQARVCALADPWATLDSWRISFEGPLPGTQGGHGRFVEPDAADNVSGGLELAAEIDFCSKGVIGGRDRRRPRDQLVITSALPPDNLIPASLREDCKRLLDTREDSALIAFPIERVFGDRVQIDENITNSKLPARLRGYQFVAKCFANMLMTFDVRTYGAYTVVGGDRVGFLHRNVLDEASGRCEIDATQSPLRQGRAYEDKPYQNAAIAFQIASRRDASGAPFVTAPGTVLGIGLTSATPKLYLDATATSFGSIQGVLPVDLRYNEIDQRLYMVDQSVRGLIPISLDLFPAATGTSFE